MEYDFFTVHTLPLLPTCTNPNCKACGAARHSANNQIAIMNLIARDNFDIV